MKNCFKYIAFFACAAAMATTTGCADTDGDGEGEFEWTGSENPQNTSYRNPVWEPSLAGGTVFKAASSFVAISSETQWAAGVDYCCPTLQSSNLMDWANNPQMSFTLDQPGEPDEDGNPTVVAGSRPQWITAPITKVSADFAKTVAGANYWMVYSTGKDNAIGAATASSSGRGPYADMGKFLSAEDLGVTTLTAPSLTVIANVNFVLGYTTESGSYIQQLNLRRGQTPTMQGKATKVAAAGFSEITLMRTDAKNFYLFGTVRNGDRTEIRYAHADALTGPYKDHAGVELTDGASMGDLLVESGSEYVSPCNPMHVFASDNGKYYIAYNATRAGQDKLPSGFLRQPLFVSPLEMGEDGWFVNTVTVKSGWTKPRFE